MSVEGVSYQAGRLKLPKQDPTQRIKNIKHTITLTPNRLCCEDSHVSCSQSSEHKQIQTAHKRKSAEKEEYSHKEETMTWLNWWQNDDSDNNKKESLMQRYERIKREIEAMEDSSSSGGTKKKKKEGDDHELIGGNGFEVDPKTANLYNLLNPMLFVGVLIYKIAYLRKIAKKEQLKEEHLIMNNNATTEADGTTQQTNTTMTRKIRRNNFHGRFGDGKKITAHEILRFVHANMDRLNDNPEINSDLSVYALLSLSKLNDAYIASFDDHFEATNLVYGTTVNRDMKRITVVFRGTVTETNNWDHNMKYQFSQMETPTMLTDKLGFSKTKTIQVHTGFKTYVFHKHYDPLNPERHGKQKYNIIKQDILDLYEKDGCQGYDLCITGHSLGGALSTLVAFEFASSKKMEPHLQGRPVINISFASPYVGDTVFNEAFQVLERAGKIQHIRVSNQHDLVAVAPPFANYTHVGLNLYLNPSASNGYELAYHGNRSMWSQWSMSSKTRHTLLDHWDRKKKIRNHMGNKTLRDVYEDRVTPSLQSRRASF